MPHNVAALLTLQMLTVILVLLLPFLFFYLFFRLQESSFERLGISHTTAVLVIAGSLLLSGVNIPMARMNSTIIALNAGGAMIPIMVSAYLFLTFRVPWLRSMIATLIVALLVFNSARLVPGMGIVTPAYIPPVSAAITAMVFVRKERKYAPTLAYVSGTMGTLIGADLMNLSRIGHLGVPLASIGGAGQFDGIYLTGIIAALLA